MTKYDKSGIHPMPLPPSHQPSHRGKFPSSWPPKSVRKNIDFYGIGKTPHDFLECFFWLPIIQQSSNPYHQFNGFTIWLLTIAMVGHFP